jgi:hypothetical protein
MAGAERTVAPDVTQGHKNIGFCTIKTLAAPDLPFAHGKSIGLILPKDAHP